MKTIVPDIPGTLVTDEMQLNFLREHVRNLCFARSTRFVVVTDRRFPGAQPVSFNKQSLDLILKKE